MILVRAAVLHSKVSNFSDELVKYSRPHRRRDGACGGVQYSGTHPIPWH